MVFLFLDIFLFYIFHLVPILIPAREFEWPRPVSKLATWVCCPWGSPWSLSLGMWRPLHFQWLTLDDLGWSVVATNHQLIGGWFIPCPMTDPVVNGRLMLTWLGFLLMVNVDPYMAYIRIRHGWFIGFQPLRCRISQPLDFFCMFLHFCWPPILVTGFWRLPVLHRIAQRHDRSMIATLGRAIESFLPRYSPNLFIKRTWGVWNNSLLSLLRDLMV